MRIIDLEQGSEKWLQYRKTHVMGTDAAVILGENKYVSRKLLWQRKWDLVPPEQENEKMRRGKDLEEPARKLLIEKTGINFKPMCVEHNDHEWLSCSLDGLSDCKRFICEIKAGSEDLHNFTLSGEVKHIYFIQVQHQLLVTGCDKCYFASYRPEYMEKPLAIIEILPDYEKMAELFEAERIFYEVNMKQFIAPEDYTLELKENRS
jgi:putative phage-type endonuclease